MRARASTSTWRRDRRVPPAPIDAARIGTRASGPILRRRTRPALAPTRAVAHRSASSPAARTRARRLVLSNGTGRGRRRCATPNPSDLPRRIRARGPRTRRVPAAPRRPTSRRQTSTCPRVHVARRRRRPTSNARWRSRPARACRRPRGARTRTWMRPAAIHEARRRYGSARRASSTTRPEGATARTRRRVPRPEDEARPGGRDVRRTAP
mmetsp:Transcript_10/g.68  ORF Transcript_10/g.68 Transcript_10/m.68 type:complete len:210 (-) Transcript_10:713-1342(-)